MAEALAGDDDELMELRTGMITPVQLLLRHQVRARLLLLRGLALRVCSGLRLGLGCRLMGLGLMGLGVVRLGAAGCCGCSGNRRVSACVG